MKKKILTKKEIDDIIGSLKDMTFLKDIKANPFFDEWNILGLHPSASIKEIKKRHRELSMIHHPDRGGDSSRMAEINQAKDFLLKWYSRFGPEEEEGEEMEEEKIEIKLDAEIMHLIPPPTEDELQRLEQSIIDEGCRDPLVLWDDILLDGHHRYDICLRYEIPFKTIVKGFDDREQAKYWVICNQLARRNLPPEQISYLRGLKHTIEENQQELKSQSETLNEPRKPGRPFRGGDTASRLAKEFGVSRATIFRDSKFAEAVDKMPEEEKKKILSGKSKKTKKEIMGEPKKGAGRRSKFLSDAAKKKIEQTEKMSEEFKEAWNKYIEQIAKAKRWGWQETSKIAAIQATQTCFDIIEAR